MATIVVVEDQPDVRKLVASLLGVRGHRVVALGEGGGVVAAVRAEQPALVLLDLDLPDIDGYTVLARLRTIEGDRPWKVVALTAASTDEDRRRVLAAGFDGYVPKPIDVRGFAAAVAAFLPGAPAEPGRSASA